MSEALTCSQGRGSPWACAILQCGTGGEAAGLGAPRSLPARPAQLPESTNIAPSGLTVGKKFEMFEMFKISGSVSKAAQMAFPEGCCYLYSTTGDSGDSKRHKS